MPKNYTPSEKAAAFFLLVKSLGNVTYVSRETGISERAIRYWKNAYYKNITLNITADPNPEVARRRKQYANIRESLYREIDKILFHLEMNNNPDLIANLAPALTRLIDRLSHIEKLLTDNQFSIRVIPLDPTAYENLPATENDMDRIDAQEIADFLAGKDVG